MYEVVDRIPEKKEASHSAYFRDQSIFQVLVQGEIGLGWVEGDLEPVYNQEIAYVVA